MEWIESGITLGFLQSGEWVRWSVWAWWAEGFLAVSFNYNY